MRTTIEIPISYSIDEANSRLRNYFGANGYIGVQNGAETVMRGGDRMVRGIWFIAPQVMQDKVILQGFVGKPGKSEKDLDGFVGAVVKAQARNDLGELQKILSAPASDSNGENNVSQPQASQAGYAPAAGTIAEKNAKFAIWSVVIGAAGCILPFFINIVAGGLAIFIGISFGVTALKTSKRALAIVGIVLNSIAALLTIVSIVLSIILR